MKYMILIMLLILSVTMIACTSNTTEVTTIEKATSEIQELTDLEKNICTQDSECWSTNGGCFTREWFTIEDAKVRETGLHNQRPTSTPDIICTCEQNKCVQKTE